VTQRILIVEDERIIARDLERRVKRFGYEVAGVTAFGEEAIRLARAAPPDLVLMDIRLRGELDGIAAAERIRDDCQIPIIFMTAYADDATLKAARATEPSAYILKPFHERELQIAIEMALYKHAAELERTRLERQARRAEKMDAIGRLAGGIAHDFNNVLLAILTSCGSLLDDLPAGDPARVPATIIRAAAERGARLTRQLMTFGRDDRAGVGPIDPGVLVSGMVEMLAALIGDDITLTTSIAPRVRHVIALPSEIEQLVLNLVVNAREAMLEGGTIGLRLAEVDGDVVLAVADTGVGIDEVTRAHMYEPFFTTKGDGTGGGRAPG
jgi:signal transduction histidine kinase